MQLINLLRESVWCCQALSLSRLAEMITATKDSTKGPPDESACCHRAVTPSGCRSHRHLTAVFPKEANCQVKTNKQTKAQLILIHPTRPSISRRCSGEGHQSLSSEPLLSLKSNANRTTIKHYLLTYSAPPSKWRADSSAA